MAGDRNAPRLIAGEKDTLLAFLDYLRESVMLKAEGLSDTELRKPMVASGTSLLGLLKHLIRVEIAWFQYSFAGFDVAIPDETLQEDDGLDTVLTQYQTALARSNEIAMACVDLSQECKRPIRTPELMPLRWVLVHMIEETGRHAGHADIIREQIDGAVGR